MVDLEYNYVPKEPTICEASLLACDKTSNEAHLAAGKRAKQESPPPNIAPSSAHPQVTSCLSLRGLRKTRESSGGVIG